jgi:hypothetical protein
MNMLFDMNGDTGTCARLAYSADVGSAGALVTLVATDPQGRRTWTVESQPPHTAGCLVSKKGKLQLSGGLITVPFYFTITELVPPS